jgi:hypothetical protein
MIKRFIPYGVSSTLIFKMISKDALRPQKNIKMEMPFAMKK